MIPTLRMRCVLVVPAAVAALTGVASATAAVSNAAECGPGTVYDAASNLCVAAPPAAQWNAPPPPPAPPPLPPLPPISICPPIPFVPVCFPVN